jgi:hypothetical protein
MGTEEVKTMKKKEKIAVLAGASALEWILDDPYLL